MTEQDDCQGGDSTMEQILPRWEWRTFGQEFGAAEPRLAALAAESVQDSEELYLVSTSSDANVKIRDDMVDIKRLERVDANGLEQWRPVLKEPFPLADSALAQIRAALGLPPEPPRTEGRSLDELLAALAPSGGPVRVVAVRKTRRRFHVHGCAAELTAVIADGQKVRTVAIEDADPAKVFAAVRAMELDRYPNTSYPRGLRQVTGGSSFATRLTIRRAVIDAGTNSVKFHVGERQPDGTWTTVVDRAEVTRLGEGIGETGSIAPAAMERTVAAIAGMAVEAARLEVGDVTAVGTMGLRTAANSRAFLDLVKERCGVAIEVITGSEEGRLAYLAVQSASGLPAGDLVIFDTGGGSSQFTFGRGPRVDRQFSVNVGAVRYTERFRLDQAASAAVLQQALGAIAADLSDLDGVDPPDVLVGMGGAVTNLAAVMHGLATYDPGRVQGTIIDRSELDRQIELYRAASAEERRRIVGLQPKRAEVILAGACIVRTIMDKLEKFSLSVSDRGLRHGILIDRFGGQLARPHSAR
jgi:exopolyphosphatase/guanosine-5'-triphosphate,3'-diphosphate pyrophosphatase